jgi:mannose-6-phosphate isomerase-like protein (cupin superfamily)
MKFEKINLQEKFDLIWEPWHPRIAGELNGQHVKLAKLQGTFIWHQHEREDEMFLVVKGRLVMEFRHASVIVEEGEFIIVPRGVEHRPGADEEVQVLLFEPAGTRNTGEVEDEHTVAQDEWI